MGVYVRQWLLINRHVVYAYLFLFLLLVFIIVIMFFSEHYFFFPCGGVSLISRLVQIMFIVFAFTLTINLVTRTFLQLLRYLFCLVYKKSGVTVLVMDSFESDVLAITFLP